MKKLQYSLFSSEYPTINGAAEKPVCFPCWIFITLVQNGFFQLLKLPSIFAMFN